ncbi:PEPxxWA-CTERM sorting domain-containing protein [Azohydromonas aeria]|uniref:PEPxxWA-CTERM sorting domain-containing protein n=1 Tax=Azohydromonas aeria TaxID=2590212 RepID=UPI0012F749B3|nr:PEPxxWA-CTERM sorting domain-containing protein [Azohydromonas aeria]
MKALLGTLLAALAGPALAAAGSSASLTGLRYELVDLRPGDGIAPSVRYTGLSVAQSKLGFCFGPVSCQLSQGGYREPVLSTVQNDRSGPASAFASVSAAGLFAAAQWDNGDRTVGSNGRYLSWARHQGVLGSPLFVLSAHTGIRITGQYTLDAWIIPTDVQEPVRRDYAASAAVFVNSRFIDGPEPFVEIDTSTSDFAHRTGEFSVLLANHKDRTSTVWGRFGVLAEGQLPVGVPEPSTWALLLAGAGVLGAVARRRQGRVPAN